MLLTILYIGGYGALVLSLLFASIGGVSLGSIWGAPVWVSLLVSAAFMYALLRGVNHFLQNRFRSGCAVGFSGLVVFGVGFAFLSSPLWRFQGMLLDLAHFYRLLGAPYVPASLLDADMAFQIFAGTFFFPLMLVTTAITVVVMRRFEILKEGL